MRQWGLKLEAVDIIMILANCVHLLVYNVVIKGTALYFKIRTEHNNELCDNMLGFLMLQHVTYIYHKDWKRSSRALPYLLLTSRSRWLCGHSIGGGSMDVPV
jgi:hypothetical protein